MMAKRMKLSFSIDQILGLHETLKQEAVEEEKGRCPLKEGRLDLTSPDNRLTAEYRSPSLPSPGSDGFNDCSDDGKDDLQCFSLTFVLFYLYQLKLSRNTLFGFAIFLKHFFGSDFPS
jgi:hypothetical protein